MIFLPIKKQFSAKGEVVLFDGFLKVYMEGTDDENGEENNNLLPPLHKGQQLDMNEMTAQERFTRHPARYTEAALVKKMEELGIGRPSTYAPTISTVQKRGYVVKEDREGTVRKYKVMSLKNDNLSEKKQLVKNTGAEKIQAVSNGYCTLVNKFLCQYFEGIIDYNFTANVEKRV